MFTIHLATFATNPVAQSCHYGCMGLATTQIDDNDTDSGNAVNRAKLPQVLWSLRMVTTFKGSSNFVSRVGYAQDDLAEWMGLGNLVDNTGAKTKRRALRERIQEFEDATDPDESPNCLCRNSVRIAELVGLSSVERRMKLVAKGSAPFARHLSEAPMYSDMRLVPAGEHFKLAATMLHSRKLHWWVLSQGDDIEITEPAVLRREIGASGYWRQRRNTRSDGHPSRIEMLR